MGRLDHSRGSVHHAGGWLTDFYRGRRDDRSAYRHLMLNLLSLERMIARGGKVSGVFT